MVVDCSYYELWLRKKDKKKEHMKGKNIRRRKRMMNVGENL